jgi:hypothetical protein
MGRVRKAGALPELDPVGPVSVHLKPPSVVRYIRVQPHTAVVAMAAPNAAEFDSRSRPLRAASPAATAAERWPYFSERTSWSTLTPQLLHFVTRL